MKKMMTISLMTILLTLSIGASKKAHAGIVLASAGSASGGVAGTLAAFGGAAVAFSGANMLSDDYLDIYEWNFVIFGAGLALLVLDVDGNVDPQNIAQSFENNYPEIADRTVFTEIANEVAVEAKKVDEDVNGNKYITLKKSKVRAILERVDTTGIETQVEEFVLSLI